MPAKRSAKILLAVLATPLLAYGALAAAVGRDGVWATLLGPPDRAPVEFQGFAIAGDAPPNRVLLCPPGLCAGPVHATSPEFPVPAERLRAAWDRVAAGRGKLRLVGEDADRRQADYEARTPLLRFPDTITIRFLPLGADRSTLAAYSRSHYGHSDFGVNAARLRALLQALAEEVGE